MAFCRMETFFGTWSKTNALNNFAIIYKDTTCAKCFHSKQLIRTAKHYINILNKYDSMKRHIYFGGFGANRMSFRCGMGKVMVCNCRYTLVCCVFGYRIPCLQFSFGRGFHIILSFGVCVDVCAIIHTLVSAQHRFVNEIELLI